MPLINKPADINRIWASSGDRAAPLESKISTGWQIEIPPRQWFNWLDNKQDQAIAHINQMGIPQWDAVTEYQANKSYVQGPTSGLVFRCLATNTGINPDVSPAGYWVVAFDAAGSGFSEAQADSRYLAKNSNLADLPSKASARQNLDVYSRAEIDSLPAKGFIAFNGSTGTTIASKNLTLTKNSTGTYTINISPEARKGNANYCVVVSAISNGVTARSYTHGSGAFAAREVWVASRAANSFVINTNFRNSRLAYAGGNDSNDAQQMSIALADYTYISLTYFW